MRTWTLGIKKFIGQALFETCEKVPFTKACLGRLGMHTQSDWFAGRTAHVQLGNGQSIILNSLSQNYLSFELFWKGANYYEPITCLLAQELAATGLTFLDIGANIGFYTLILSICNPGLKVIAFEPNPKNFSLLRENVTLNGLANVACEPLAVSDESGTSELYLSASDMSASLEPGFEASESSIEVFKTSLDDYLLRNGVACPLLIKVDIEGHEPSFFKGARRTLEKLHPDIICEITSAQENTMNSLLRDAGYRFYQITDVGLLPADKLDLVVRNRLVFLNYLLSARPETEIASLFEDIRDRVRRIDLRNTSKNVSSQLLAEMRARAGAVTVT